MTEAQKTAMQKANLTIEYLRANDIGQPFEVSPANLVTDFKTFVDSHEAALNSIEPLNNYWKAWYMRIYGAKQYIEKYIKDREND